MSRQRQIAILLFVSLVAWGLACGGEESTSPSASAPSDGAPAGEAAAPASRRQVVSSRGPGHESVKVEVVTGNALPEGFPSDLPMFPNATASNAIAVPGQGTFVGLQSSASAKEVYAFYAGQLEKAGWQVEKTGGGREIIATKDRRKASIKINSAGGQTEIGVMVEGG